MSDKTIVVMPAYNAETTLEQTVADLPEVVEAPAVGVATGVHRTAMQVPGAQDFADALVKSFVTENQCTEIASMLDL